MSVTLLSRHREDKKAAPALVVERITESTYQRWQIEPGAKCTWSPYGFGCSSTAQFLVRPLGAKRAWRVCDSCLSKRAKHMLERPAGEAERLESKKIERMRQRQAIADAKKAHDEAGLCESSSRKTISGLCDRPPKFLVETPCDSRRAERLCAHHTAPWRRKLVSEYVREENGDGTVSIIYNHRVEKRLRRITPILTRVPEGGMKMQLSAERL